MAKYQSAYTGEQIDSSVRRAMIDGEIDVAVKQNAEDIAKKQNILTFDTTPTENSTNPVTSGGVFESVTGKENVSTYIIYTLLASNWNNNQYSFETEYPSDTYNLEIALSENTTSEQFEAFGNAAIIGNSEVNIIKALGGSPSIDIEVIIKVVKK